MKNWLNWFREFRELDSTLERHENFNLFADSELNHLFVKQGFVVVRTGQKKLFENIRSEYDRLSAELDSVIQGKGFINTSELPAGEVKRQQEQLIGNYADRIFHNVFKPDTVDIQPEVFFVKPPNSSSEVAIHQDAVIVDERKRASFHCWIPLQQSDVDNGGLQVIPGSHKLVNPHRAFSVPWEFSNYGQVLADHLMPVKMELGDILIYDRALIHYSPPNISDDWRVAMAYTVAERPLQFLHLLLNSKSKEVEFYEVSSDFLLNEDPFSKPTNGKLLKKEKLHQVKHSERQFRWLCQKAVKTAGVTY
jgi:hypothetical protein